MGERHGARSRARGSAGTAAFGAGYLAWAVGWAIAGLHNSYGPEGVLPALLYNAGQVLAVLAPLLWFAAAVWLARPGRALAGWLAAGLLLLAPLPLVVGVR